MNIQALNVAAPLNISPSKAPIISLFYLCAKELAPLLDFTIFFFSKTL